MLPGFPSVRIRPQSSAGRQTSRPPAARHFGAGRIVAAGRNQQVLDRLPELGADAVIQLSQPDDTGPAISLPAAVLRSAGLEIFGQGTGTMPPADVITGLLRELLDLLASGKVHIDIDRVPLSTVDEVWARDQRGRRPVFIP
jgi:NADPH:quinone reductase-like Zn-dependent oxidoreductase